MTEVTEEAKEVLELKRAYKRFSLTDDGKKIRKDLDRFCGMERTSVCEHDPNAYQTFFAEGKRRVALRINQFIKEEEDG